jgi:Glyoxalase-like domain
MSVRPLRSRSGTGSNRLMLQLLGFIIDCPDPMKLAAFYPQVTGRAIMDGSSDGFAGISFGEVDLAFQRVENYRPPRWPDGEHPKT